MSYKKQILLSINKKYMWTIIILSSISIGSAIHWSLAMIWYDGMLNINSIGEGWIEALAFAAAGIIGFHELNTQIKGVNENE